MRIGFLTAALILAGAVPAQRGIELRRLGPAAAASWRRVDRGGKTVAIDLDRRLPGLPQLDPWFRYPFRGPVERVDVLSDRAAGRTVLVIGGVRSDLAYHVFGGRGGGVELRLARARLAGGYLRPWLDTTGSVLVAVFEDRGGWKLRAVSLRGERPRTLLARELESLPVAVRFGFEIGNPLVRVDLGRVRMRAPGQTAWQPVSREPPTFLHPLAAYPVPSKTQLDFGDLARGRRAKREFDVRNPGALRLRLLLRLRPARGWRGRIEPESLVLDAGAKRSASIELERAGHGGRFAGEVEILAIGGAKAPLARLAVFARAIDRRDTTPPVIARTLVTISLLPDRVARIVGAAAAVRDESFPCRLRLAGERRVPVRADGGFAFDIERDGSGRVLLWAEDKNGNRSQPVSVRVPRDTQAPRVRVERLELGLPLAGRVRLTGRPGAVVDATPPLRIEVEVGGRLQGNVVAVRADGSFRTVVAARSGQRVRVFAVDGAAQLNRSKPIAVGSVLPFVSRAGGELVLHGPSGALFRLATLVAAAGTAPPAVLSRLRGRLDARGRIRLDKAKLHGADRLEFVVTVPGTARRLEGSFDLR